MRFPISVIDERRLRAILDAIARSRVADKRLRLAESLGDDVGVQIAYQAILHNLSVIGEAVKATPPEILEQDLETPWSGIAAMSAATERNYQLLVPADIHRTVEADLSVLDTAVRRLLAT